MREEEEEREKRERERKRGRREREREEERQREKRERPVYKYYTTISLVVLLTSGHVLHEDADGHGRPLGQHWRH